ncbi:DUF1481 domain-containing protein [Acerihabitans sp.]|uniref:DUF1481 domain-containing protein n=1 Tax=Acerihabitans sp. TaxID=2811394 RepID=UPI002ED8F15B
MPLLFLRRCGWLGLLTCVLTACGSHTKAPPAFTASGYVADGGAVRLWRKDDRAQQTVNIVSVYSPYQGENTVITRYQFLREDVRQITRTQNGEHPLTVQIRFDEQGNPSYMQRQRDGIREKLSDDELALYVFEARRLLDVSKTLRAGQVKLVQANWRNGVMVTCDGKQVKPDLDERSISWIAARAHHSTGQLGVAWLEAPEGTQLLLVANEDFCHWQPKKSEL